MYTQILKQGEFKECETNIQKFEMVKSIVASLQQPYFSAHADIIYVLLF